MSCSYILQASQVHQATSLAGGGGPLGNDFEELQLQIQWFYGSTERVPGLRVCLCSAFIIVCSQPSHVSFTMAKHHALGLRDGARKWEGPLRQKLYL